MPASLTQQDVTRLLSNPSAEARAELGQTIGDMLADSGLAPHEIELAHDIVRVLAADIEEQVRTALSRSLRHAGHLPRDVALRLATDVDSVALPMLADSLMLSDEDLIAIVRGGSGVRQEAIAGRRGLGESVSDALVVHGGEQAVVVLMQNPSARISEASLTHATDRFAHSDSVKQAMVLRNTLPITVAERLTALVSKELQDHLVRNHALPPQIAADLVLRSREHAMIRLSAGASDEALVQMVTQMEHNGRLTPTLLLRALCTGDIAFFEIAMAVKGGVPLENAQALIHDRGRNGLTALYRKAGMPERLLTATQAVIDVLAETGFDGNARDLERFRARVISRVLTCVSFLDPEDADYLLDKLGDILVHTPDGELPSDAQREPADALT
ncbi:MAG TPA: DUF2336 domain-containing protein [Rhodopila sp.]|uniref:DUF2336 domain-containing protein n=1 Tax=Rhodopila sp. TaxID=2480087 RepID=UPI002B9F544A|nr:DUF2336 domain-containing protein [Rhodopila sp.]HVY17148.1 DUF2336 domain-containing protein [Rhodopila sp.]